MDSAQEPQPPAPEVREEAPAEEASIERLMEHVPQAVPTAQQVTQTAPAAPALRTARVVSLRGREAQIAWRGRGAAVSAVVDEGVHTELVARALASGDAVLVEHDPEAGPVIVGVVQTRVPDELHLRARKVTVEADEELVLRAGRGALRIREDGDVELVGSRISTLSRGLFRIVGRVLRLN